MTRLGKIARLPHGIREELNFRLHDGEEGRQLVAWLNGLPEAQAVLVAKFGGRPVNEQNLSEWKQGGFEDWLRHQQDCADARMLTENARELEHAAAGIRLEDRLAAPLALALARLLREADESPDGAEKQKTLLGVARELANLRRGSHEAERVRLKSERWEAERAADWARHMVQHPEYSGGGLLNGELRSCLEANARLLHRQNARVAVKALAPAGVESNPIKPNQTGSSPQPAEVNALSAA